jgi:hypothetical protein
LYPAPKLVWFGAACEPIVWFTMFGLVVEELKGELESEDDSKLEGNRTVWLILHSQPEDLSCDTMKSQLMY